MDTHGAIYVRIIGEDISRLLLLFIIIERERLPSNKPGSRHLKN